MVKHDGKPLQVPVAGGEGGTDKNPQQHPLEHLSNAALVSCQNLDPGLPEELDSAFSHAIRNHHADAALHHQLRQGSRRMPLEHGVVGECSTIVPERKEQTVPRAGYMEQLAPEVTPVDDGLYRPKDHRVNLPAAVLRSVCKFAAWV